MSAESQKLRRDRARELGMCLVCTTRAMFDGRSTCARCHALKSGWNKASAPAAMMRVEQRRRETRFNTCCQAVGFHRAGCHEQRAA